MADDAFCIFWSNVQPGGDSAGYTDSKSALELRPAVLQLKGVILSDRREAKNLLLLWKAKKADPPLSSG
jgi:hypothetical protein